MKEVLKKNITLVIALAIPALMVIFVAASIYLPGLFVKPKTDFLYAVGDTYCSGVQMYKVEGGKIKKLDIPTTDASGGIRPYPIEKNVPAPGCKDTKLYYYDVVKNEGREISLGDAEKLKLDGSAESPDGFEVVQGSSGDGFPFGTSVDYKKRYLKGHNLGKELNILLTEQQAFSFQFVGWVIQ